MEKSLRRPPSNSPRPMESKRSSFQIPSGVVGNGMTPSTTIGAISGGLSISSGASAVGSWAFANTTLADSSMDCSSTSISRDSTFGSSAGAGGSAFSGASWACKLVIAKHSTATPIRHLVTCKYTPDTFHFPINIDFGI